MPYIQSTISSKNQVVVPAQIRQALKLTSGDQLLWRVARIHDQTKVLAERMPKSWASDMKGLGKDLWKKVSLDEYIDTLRNEWQHI
jgi:AbrB family looped-hinge helix DNA binding protein